MRTKTLALSAILGAIGAVSAVAQTNVYSINAVGYVNVTLYPGYNLITCPVIGSPDNTLATLLNNTNGQYQIGTGRTAVGAVVFPWINGLNPNGSGGFSGGYVGGDVAKSSGTAGWTQGGTNTINPGAALWFLNPGNISTGSNMYATFVGTVPQNSTPTNAQLPYGLTNTLYPGFNLVGSVVPASGDLITNSISFISNSLAHGAASGDTIFVFDPTTNGPGTQGGYATGIGGTYVVNRKGVGSWNGSGALPDPTTVNVTEAFWYLNNTNNLASSNNWVENFSINP